MAMPVTSFWWYRCDLAGADGMARFDAHLHAGLHERRILHVQAAFEPHDLGRLDLEDLLAGLDEIAGEVATSSGRTRSRRC